MAAGIPVPLLFFLLWRFLLYFPHPAAPLPSRAGFCADPGQRRSVQATDLPGCRVDEKHMGQPSLRLKAAARGRSFQRKKT